MGWGDFLGGIAGTIGDLWSDNKNRQLSKDQFEKTTLTYRVNEAKRLGLSPLAVLGTPTASPTVMGGGQSNLGSNLKDTISAAARAAKPKEPKAKSDPLDRKIKSQQLRNLEAEELAILSGVAKESQPGTPRPPPDVPGNIVRKFGPNGRPYLYQEFYDQYTGKTVSIPVEEANMDMPESVGAAMALKAKHDREQQDLKKLGVPARIPRRKSKNVEWHPSMKQKSKKYRGPRRK